MHSSDSQLLQLMWQAQLSNTRKKAKRVLKKLDQLQTIGQESKAESLQTIGQETGDHQFIFL